MDDADLVRSGFLGREGSESRKRAMSWFASREIAALYMS